MRDDLTGLYNRRAFFDEANAAIAREQRQWKTAALMMLDVDYFKRINDQFGHGVGDIVLREISHACNDIIHNNQGFMGRLGGEEFAVMLLDVSLSKALAIADQLRQTVATRQISS